MTRPSEDHLNSQGLRVALQQSPAAAGLPCPRYATAGSSGVDLIACNDDVITLRRGEVTLIPTGISIALPSGFEAQVRARSGLALKHGVALVNAPGTIDADYRGEIGVIATVLVDQPFRVERGMRIAQLVIAPVTQVSFQPVENLEATERGAGGFGHTGTESEGAPG